MLRQYILWSFLVLPTFFFTGCSQKNGTFGAGDTAQKLPAGVHKAGIDPTEIFFQLCDSAYADVIANVKVQERVGARGFYWDSYAVRALCAAYDMTGKQEYLDACKQWSNRMIEFQEQMIPEGAYYMSYGRKPGEKNKYWFTADCSSLGLAVLATAVRCSDPNEKEKLLNSVKSFGALVRDHFVRPSGGVSNWFWPKSNDAWWCSTGIFGSLAFQLYKETGDESYLNIGLGAIDWLNTVDFETVAVHFPLDEIVPVVLMYCLEAYSTAFPFLEKGSTRYWLAMAQWAKAFAWMKENFGGNYGLDYAHQWGSKFGGLPFHMYTYAEFNPGNEELVRAADKELEYCMKIIENPKLSSLYGVPEFFQQVDQLAIFTMFSYTQKLCPGLVYRSGTESVNKNYSIK